jgi:site-specific DNA-methyltransferase (adenine-specific)
MFSFVGDSVLDPFWGIGSLTAAAMKMHRSSIGIEIEPEYIKRARERFESLPFDGGIEFTTGPSLR